MNALIAKHSRQAFAKSARVTATILSAQFNDGREITAPFAKARWLAWLTRATPKQRVNWTIEPGGFAIYWPDFDDGVEVCHLLDPQAIG
jgi:hypothetical protein